MTDRLTSLERSVLQLLGTGSDVPEIARRLGVHQSTVLWCVGHLVTMYGPQRVEALAASLARPASAEALVAERPWTPRRSMVGASVLYALSIGFLITSIAVAAAWVVDGVHNGPAATARPASPTESAPASVPAATLDPLATATYTPQSAPPQSSPGTAATAPPLAPLITAVPSAPPLPAVPSVPLPTVAPTPALPLPPLPTVPPLPTPHLP
jgi:DNA-binding CsgD family transcriptional regulator